VAARVYRESLSQQGLIQTQYDGLDYAGQVQFPEEKMVEILRVRAYLLEVFNHPDRIAGRCGVSPKISNLNCLPSVLTLSKRCVIRVQPSQLATWAR